MEDAVVAVRFPEGPLTVRGFRCAVCGDDSVLAGELGRAEALARRLGLYGAEKRARRKLQKTGNSITVSIDRGLLDEVLPGAGPGSFVSIGKLGNRIVIEPDRVER
ncbi:MAG TPA: hypothetical protein VGR28_14930 [Candidatus Thermoplasmatota archaeon]|jgi:hypothetical protein|nr:hypothetical protein [Candidatus Thermoplasmatota archaeon]